MIDDRLPSRFNPTLTEIMQSVCVIFDVKMSDLTSPDRHRSVARPRQIAMYLGRALTARSTPEIGRRLGNRDHTTVIHGIRQIAKLADEDTEILWALKATAQGAALRAAQRWEGMTDGRYY